jgi:putative nucleotidyltransferase with HDIG domain
VLEQARERLIATLRSQPPPSPEHVLADVEADVGLTIAVLRLASRRAARASTIGSVSDALRVFGLREIEDAARDARVYGVLDPDPTRVAAKLPFRAHAHEVKGLADRVARAAGAANGSEIGTAALLHDIGKLALAEASPSYAHQVSVDGRTPERRVVDERRLYGVDHAAAGAKLIRRWNLSPRLEQTIANHHACDACDEAALVRLADMLAHFAHGRPVEIGQLVRASRAIGLDQPALPALLCDLPDPVPAPPDKPVRCPLSTRELEVLRQLAQGRVYKQIANELDLTPSTVRTHLHRIYRKIGAVDRAQAVLKAAAEGWI